MSAASPAPSAPPDLGPRFRRLYAIFAIVVVIVAIVAGVGGFYAGRMSAASASSGKVTVTYFDDLASSEGAFWDNTLIPQFEANYTNITVNPITDLDAETIVSDIQALESGGHVGTAVIGEDNLVIGNLVYAGDLMNLTPIASSIAPSTLIPSMNGVVTYEKSAFNGAEYFIPLRANTPLVFCNQTTLSHAGFTSAPATDAALLSAAQKLGPSSVMFQDGAGDDLATEVFQWMVQWGGNPMVYNDTGDFQTMSYLYNLSAYFNPGYTAATYAEYTGLAAGKYSVLDYQWPYVYNFLQPAMGSSLGVYQGPAGPSSTQGSDHLIGGDVLAIPKGVQNPWAAEQLAKFLLSTPVQRLVITKLGEPAVNSAAYQGLNASASALYSILEQALQHPVFRPPVPWIETWVGYMYTAFNNIMKLTSYSPSAILAQLGSAHTQMYNYLVANYGQQNATLYNSGAFGPLFPTS